MQFRETETVSGVKLGGLLRTQGVPVRWISERGLHKCGRLLGYGYEHSNAICGVVVGAHSVLVAGLETDLGDYDDRALNRTTSRE